MLCGGKRTSQGCSGYRRLAINDRRNFVTDYEDVGHASTIEERQ
jgi:hypothetical protein